MSARLIPDGRMEDPGKKRTRKVITIKGITDMEGNPASPPMIKALSSRIETLMKEMGLTADIATDVHLAADEQNEREIQRPARLDRKAGDR